MTGEATQLSKPAFMKRFYSFNSIGPELKMLCTNPYGVLRSSDLSGVLGTTTHSPGIAIVSYLRVTWLNKVRSLIMPNSMWRLSISGIARFSSVFGGITYWSLLSPLLAGKGHNTLVLSLRLSHSYSLGKSSIRFMLRKLLASASLVKTLTFIKSHFYLNASS
jgi:hypothetical protein